MFAGTKSNDWFLDLISDYKSAQFNSHKLMRYKAYKSKLVKIIDETEFNNVW